MSQKPASIKGIAAGMDSHALAECAGGRLALMPRHAADTSTHSRIQRKRMTNVPDID